MKLALAFARNPVHSNTYLHFLPPHSDCVVRELVIEPKPELKSEPAIAVMVVATVAAVSATAAVAAAAAALVAMHGAAIVYMFVATFDV